MGIELERSTEMISDFGVICRKYKIRIETD